MGNEASQSQKLGERLENDTKVTWMNPCVDCPYAAREGHCAASVGHKLFVFGGVTQTDDVDNIESNELLVFDLEESKWSRPETTGDTPAPRSAATMAAVDSKLYLMGGLSRNTGWLEDVHIYDTESRCWSRAETQGEGPSPRDKLASAVIAGNIYVFGGFGPQNPDEEEVEEFSDDDEGVDEAVQDQDAAHFGWYDDLFILDPKSMTWSQPVQMNLGGPSPRAAHAMTAVQDKYLVIFGGRDSEARRNDLHIFDTETRKWIRELQVKGRAPEPRSFHTLTTVETRVAVFGGRGVVDQHFPELHFFDTVSREWLQPTIEGNVPEPRAGHSVTVVGDHLLLYGGSSHFNKELMQSTQLHGDVHTIKTVDVITGKAIPKAMENQENLSATANVAPTKGAKAEGLATANGHASN